jgi:hypothetical protein
MDKCINVLLDLSMQRVITSLVSFDHCVVCPSLIYRFWLPLWYPQALLRERPFNLKGWGGMFFFLKKIFPLQTGSELRYSVLRVSSSCSTSDTRHVNRVVVTFTIGTSHGGLLRSRLTQKHTYIYIYILWTGKGGGKEKNNHNTISFCNKS